MLSRTSKETVVSAGGISDEAIPARLGWQPTNDGLRLAWQLTIDDSAGVDLWNAAVDAETGELLDAANWTSHSSPNPAGDGASYRVFEFPKGDPNDGPRTLALDPADALASPFGWHDTDGAPGPEFTRTQGNNVQAYTDRDANNQPDPGSDPDGGPTLTFDFVADYLNEHPQTYPDAAVTNLFYWCNTVHDLTYQNGFDEASGNFQVNNYGRGGSAATTSAARRRTGPARTTLTSRRPRTTEGARGCRCSSGPALSSGSRTLSRWTGRPPRPARTGGRGRVGGPGTLTRDDGRQHRAFFRFI